MSTKNSGNAEVRTVVEAGVRFTCGDPDLLHRTALDFATRHGVTATAYETARCHAPDGVAFDVETILFHALRSAGCAADLSISTRDDEALPPRPLFGDVGFMDPSI